MALWCVAYRSLKTAAGENIQVNHQVILKLPRRIDLSVSSVSGSLKAGDVDGQTHVSSISGSAQYR